MRSTSARPSIRTRRSANRSALPPRRSRASAPTCLRCAVDAARVAAGDVPRRRFATPEAFFDRFFVANYCPLLFLEASGRNLPLDKLAVDEQRAIAAHCDEALRETVRLLAPRCVLGIGRFAERRAGIALAGLDVNIGSIPHPSPASPAANRGWDEQAERAIAGCGVELRAPIVAAVVER